MAFEFKHPSKYKKSNINIDKAIIYPERELDNYLTIFGLPNNGNNIEKRVRLQEETDKNIEKLQDEVAKKLGYKLVDHKLELYGSKIKK